jgi:putative transcriptional regulator
MAKIRNRLSAILGERRISIKEFERQSGVSYPSLHDLYHERSKRIDFDTLLSILTALDIGISDLLYIDNNGAQQTEDSKDG